MGCFLICGYVSLFEVYTTVSFLSCLVAVFPISAAVSQLTACSVVTPLLSLSDAGVKLSLQGKYIDSILTGKKLYADILS